MRDSRNGSYATMGGWLPLGRRKVRGPGAARQPNDPTSGYYFGSVNDQEDRCEPQSCSIACSS